MNLFDGIAVQPKKAGVKPIIIIFCPIKLKGITD